jgi:hypothetical protein
VPIPSTFEADALHALLVLRADAIEGCTQGSEEEREFTMIAEAVEAYEAIRWPDGKVPCGNQADKPTGPPPVASIDAARSASTCVTSCRRAGSPGEELLGLGGYKIGQSRCVLGLARGPSRRWLARGGCVQISS